VWKVIQEEGRKGDFCRKLDRKEEGRVIFAENQTGGTKEMRFSQKVRREEQRRDDSCGMSDNIKESK